MTRVVLIRHGEVDFDLLNDSNSIFQGARYDLVPLSKRGIEQIELLSEQLSGEDFSLVLTSPYTRNLQSCSLLSRALGLSFRVEPNLHDWLPERDPAIWPTRSEQLARSNEYVACIATGVFPVKPAWETADDIRVRVGAVLNRYCHLESLLVVTHKAVIELLSKVNDVPLASATRILWC
ncbi:MAG: histidine phosphatase family protein [Gemmatimonadota bacterium]|nr:histidine phosphatase family protein [Gemmatimonadota bacterium]